MLVTRRIYVSLPADRWLSPSMNDLKWAMDQTADAVVVRGRSSLVDAAGL